MKNSFEILNFFLAALLFCCIEGLTFPQYRVKTHPIFGISPNVQEVIVNRYYRFANNKLSTNGMYFSPRMASYNKVQTGATLFQNLDVLYVFGTKGREFKTRQDTFVEVHLNRPAKVLLLITGRGFDKSILNNPRVEGLEGMYTFGNAQGVISSKTKSTTISHKFRRPIKLPGRGVIVEGRVESVLKLPHPRLINVNGKFASRYHILFAKDTDDLIEIDYPGTPKTIFNPLTNSVISTASNPAIPNTKCPDWLHDLHVTLTRETQDNTTTLKDHPYWRTWHPQIDPVYWCYYTHEHGSFPGNHFPMFGYMAWKTFQKDGTLEQRQDESHNGFKVFSFPLHTSERFVILVVHMQVSKARRFSTRRHTTSIAILDKNWKLELELHMKMDFGASKATLRTKRNIPIGDEDRFVMESLKNRNVVAGRRFNILNIDKNFPESVDNRFLLNRNLYPKLGNSERLKVGIYEKWEGPLNTCSKSTNPRNRGFRFDIRDPSTAIRFFDKRPTENNQQALSGYGVNRILVIPGSSGNLEISKNHCHFNVLKSETGIDLEQSNGVFYTDSYFEQVKSGPGKYNPRQFISPEFPGVTLVNGTLLPVDPWNAHMDYEKEKKDRDMSRYFNIELGIDREEN